MADVLSSKTVFRGRVFSISSDRVRLPQGVEATLDVVRHLPSVVILLMPDPSSVVLVRQYRYPVDRWLWELPAGTLEPNEDPEAAALRECEEETGYAASRAERLASFFPVPGYCDEEMIFYKLSGLTRPAQPASPDQDEHLEPRQVSLEEARAMVRSGVIVDLKSALALTLI
jgi:ADP-ribose pyrophosphatase